MCNHHRLVVAVAWLVAALSAGPAASALDIQIIVDRTGSYKPSYDPNLDELERVLNAAAQHWEDLIKDTHTMTFTVRYGNYGGLASTAWTARSGDRVTAADCTFAGLQPDWYFDPTTDVHSEYDMVNYLYRNLASGDQTDWFTGSVPDELEAGCVGLAPSGSPAYNKYDVYCVALHEIGHNLGLPCPLDGAVDPRLIDNEYDFNPSLVNGNTMAATTYDGAAHLKDLKALMQPWTGPGERKLPSATDLFAMESIAGWTQIDLKRKYFIGASSWTNTSNWAGNRLPDSGDTVYLLDGGAVYMYAPDYIENLIVSDGSDLYTNDEYLRVYDTTSITYTSGFFGTGINVGNGSTFITDYLEVNGGYFDAGTGSTVTVNENLTLSSNDGSTGELRGDSTVTIHGNLINDGVIKPGSGEVLILVDPSPASSCFDLDGSTGDGEVDASAGRIMFQGKLTDGFDGTMTIGDGQEINFNNPVTMNNGSTLTFDGTSATATLAGTTFIISSDIDVTGAARINGNVTFGSGTSATIAAGGLLELNNDTTYNGGVFSGAGELQQDGDATFAGNTTISVDLFDWDGVTVSSTTINPGVMLTINSDGIEGDPTTDGYDGIVSVNSGILSVNTSSPWRLDSGATLNLHKTSTTRPEVRGSATMEVYGTIDVMIAGEIDCDSVIHSGAQINVSAGETLYWQDHVEFAGGTHTCQGNWVMNDDVAVTAGTTLNVESSGYVDAATVIDVDAGSTLYVNGGKVAIGSVAVTPSNNHVEVGSGGHLNLHGRAKIGTTSTPSDGTLYIAGSHYLDVTGGMADIDDDIYVGTSTPGTMNVSNGGDVSSGDGWIGYYTSAASTATVTGAGSTWTTNGGIMRVGYQSEGNLNIQAGGVVTTDDGYIGINNASGDRSTVTVTGSGSEWDVGGSGYLYVSYGTGYGTLSVESSGYVDVGRRLDVNANGRFYVAGGKVAIGNVSVTPASNHVEVGPSGTLNMHGGGWIGETTYPGSGQLAVSANHYLDVTGGAVNLDSALYVGVSTPGTMTISNGGDVSANTVTIGDNTSTAGTVTVTGAGSTLTSTGSLAVGSEGEGTMNVQAGGLVSTGSNGFIGYDSASSDMSTVTVTGGGSEWDVAGYLGVGQGASDGYGTLNVQSSGYVDVGAELDVNSNSTLYVNGGRIAVGNVSVTPANNHVEVGAGGTLNIHGRAKIGTSTTPGVGQLLLAGSHYLDVTGGAIDADGDLYVGRTTPGTMNVSNGGDVSSGDGWVGYYTSGASTATVTGGGSTWTTNGGIMRVGYQGEGDLNIQSGGVVTTGNSYIGVNNASGDWSTVTVTGSGSEWDVGGSGRLYVAYGTGYGTLNVESSGLADVSSYVHVGNRGVLNVDNGRVEIGAVSAAAVNGELRIGNGGTFRIDGEATVSGQITLESGGIFNLSGGIASMDSFDNSAGGTFNFTGGNLDVATVFGDLPVNGGTIARGASPGTMTVNGDLIINSGAVEIELGGAAPGDYDRILVNGAASPGGTLDIYLIDLGGGLFQPDIGDTFDIIDWTAPSGEFDSVNPPALGPGLGWDTSDLYTTGEISVIGTLTLPGDTDEDWDVDIDDYNNFLAAFGGAGDGHTDFNEDGLVDLEDLAIQRNNFGFGVLSSPGAESGATTPEPASAALLLLGLGAVARRRRSCHRS